MGMVYLKFNIVLIQCNSDEASELVEKFDINEVPTLALFHPHKVMPEILSNPNPEKLSQTIEF